MNIHYLTNNFANKRITRCMNSLNDALVGRVDARFRRASKCSPEDCDGTLTGMAHHYESQRPRQPPDDSGNARMTQRCVDHAWRYYAEAERFYLFIFRTHIRSVVQKTPLGIRISRVRRLWAILFQGLLSQSSNVPKIHS